MPRDIIDAPGPLPGEEAPIAAQEPHEVPGVIDRLSHVATVLGWSSVGEYHTAQVDADTFNRLCGSYAASFYEVLPRGATVKVQAVIHLDDTPAGEVGIAVSMPTEAYAPALRWRVA